MPIGAEDDARIEHQQFKQTGDVLETTFDVPEGEYKMKISHRQANGEAFEGLFLWNARPNNTSLQ